MMSQSDFGTMDAVETSGLELAAILNAWRTALHSLHKGSTRPAYAVAGMLWIKDATNPWGLYVFDGAKDILVGSVNTSTNVFTPSFGALSGLVKADGVGGAGAATVTDILALIGASAVQNATHASSSDLATEALVLKSQGEVHAESVTPASYSLGGVVNFVHGAGTTWPSLNYGTVTTSKGYYGGGGTLQIYTPYGATIGGKALRVRFGNYDVNEGDSWTPWKSLIASDMIGDGLSWDGTNLNCTVETSAGRGFALITATQGWTVPAGVKSAYATLIAPGGGGSGSNGGIGSRGGRGGVVKALVTGLVPGASIACTVGAIGTGGAPNANGVSGGTTSFGSYVTTTGGVGGSHNGNGAAANGSYSVGSGVTALANAFAVFSAAGSVAAYAKLNNSDFINTASNTGGVTGGGTYTGSYDGYNGSAGTGYGSGGGAGSSPGWSATGANGGAGVILLEW